MQYSCFVLYLCYNQSFVWVLYQYKEPNLNVARKYANETTIVLPVKYPRIYPTLLLLQVLLVLLWHEGTSIYWHWLSRRHIFAISEYFICLLPLGDVSKLFFRSVYLRLILFSTDFWATWRVSGKIFDLLKTPCTISYFGDIFSIFNFLTEDQPYWDARFFHVFFLSINFLFLPVFQFCHFSFHGLVF